MKKSLEIRNAYDPSPRSYLPLQKREFTRVKQEFAKEVNINYIFRRLKDGIQPPSWMTSKTPRYGDLSNMPASLTEAFNIVAKAKEAFNSLPVGFRSAIDNRPQNIENAPRELWEKYGLLNKAPVNERSGTPDASSAGASQGGPGGERPPAKKASKEAAPQSKDEE